MLTRQWLCSLVLAHTSLISPASKSEPGCYEDCPWKVALGRNNLWTPRCQTQLLFMEVFKPESSLLWRALAIATSLVTAAVLCPVVMATSFPNSPAIFYKSFRFPCALKSTRPRDNSRVIFFKLSQEILWTLLQQKPPARASERPCTVNLHNVPTNWKSVPQRISCHISFRLTWTLQENEAENKEMSTTRRVYTAQSLMSKDHFKRFQFGLLLQYFWD